MSTLKLYTEEQVKKALDLYRSPTRPLAEQVIEKLTPIELPSDEEIYIILRCKKMFDTDWGFIEGAKWMKEQILNQNI